MGTRPPGSGQGRLRAIASWRCFPLCAPLTPPQEQILFTQSLNATPEVSQVDSRNQPWQEQQGSAPLPPFPLPAPPLPARRPQHLVTHRGPPVLPRQRDPRPLRGGAEAAVVDQEPSFAPVEV